MAARNNNVPHEGGWFGSICFHREGTMSVVRTAVSSADYEKGHC